MPEQQHPLSVSFAFFPQSIVPIQGHRAGSTQSTFLGPNPSGVCGCSFLPKCQVVTNSGLVSLEVYSLNVLISLLFSPFTPSRCPSPLLLHLYCGGRLEESLGFYVVKTSRGLVSPNSWDICLKPCLGHT